MTASGSEEILIVDDEDDNRAALSQVLASAGYAVRDAADGAACLAAVDAHPPALILLDVSMPGFDGLETLKRLRAGAHRDVPVILLTGHRLEPEAIGSGLELGAEEYLSKPVRAAELLARIRALLKLQGARRELEALKRDQTAMLVHDLKQPLAIIALRAEFMTEEAESEAVSRSGQVIREACRQMERLIESVLELSRVEAGHLRLQRTACDVASLVDDVVEQFRGLAERRGIRLELDVRGALPASLDRMKITQVIQNLIGNALKFTPPGGAIEIVVRRGDAGEAMITVQDSGCGLGIADPALLFDKYHQTRVGRAQGGSGLGLAIARAIIEAHSGQIGAGDREDGSRGARFWFTLPLAAPLQRHAAAWR